MFIDYFPSRYEILHLLLQKVAVNSNYYGSKGKIIKTQNSKQLLQCRVKSLTIRDDDNLYLHYGN